MTQDDIIKLAIEAKLPHYWPSGDEIVYIERVEHFANLITQHTLEEVAEKFEKMPFGDTSASFAVYVRNMKS